MPRDVRLIRWGALPRCEVIRWGICITTLERCECALPRCEVIRWGIGIITLKV